MTTMQAARSALDRAVAIITSKPATGQRTYAATAIVESGMRCRITEKHYELLADLPCSMGGDDSGPSPSVLARAAMASCTAIGVKVWAARVGIEIERVEARFETDVDARGQLGVCEGVTAGFERGRLCIRVVSPEGADRVREAVRLSLKYSPMMDAMRCRAPVEIAISVSASHREEVL